MKKIKPSGSPWTRFVLRYRIPILAVLVMLTVFLGYQIRGLRISQDIGVLFPPNHPNMQLHKEYQKMLATPDKLICVLEVKNGDIYTQETIAKIHRLTQEIMRLPGCDASDIKSITEASVKHMAATSWGVETNPVIFPKMPETPEDFNRLRERVETDPGIRGVLVSYDGTAAAIMAKWEKGSKLGPLYRDIKRITLAESNDRYGVYFTGAPALGANMVHLTGQIKTAVIWAIAALLLILALYLRSVSGILLSVATLVLSTVWAAGLIATLGITISFLAIVWVLFFCGTSVAFAAFCFDRYRCSTLREKQPAIDAVFGDLLAPVTVGLIALGLSATALSMADVPLLSQTGHIGACWSLATFVTVMVFNPIILSFLPIPKPRLSKFKAGPARDIFPIGIILFVLILLIGGSISAIHLTVGDNEPGSAFFFPNNSYNRAFALFNKKFIGAYNMTVVVEGRKKGALKDLGAMELIDQFQNYLYDETDARASISIAMMIKIINRLYHEGNPKWALIPVAQRERTTLGGVIKMKGSTGQWMDETWTNGSIQAMYGDDDNGLIKKRLAKARAFVRTHPSDKVNFRLFTGFLGTIAAMNDAGCWAYWASLCGALLLSFVICVLLFRTLGLCMVFLLSMVTAQGAAWIFMVSRSIRISIHSVPAAPLSIGFGTALGICLVFCARKTRQQFPDNGDGFKTALKSLARPLAFMGLIPAVMMLPWAWIDLKFMAEAGALLSVSVIAQTVAVVIILPCLMDFFKINPGDRKKFHVGNLDGLIKSPPTS